MSWSHERLKDVAAINRWALPASTDPNYEFSYLEISNVDYFGVVDAAAIENLRFEDAPSRARRVVAADSTVISSVRPNLQAVAYFPDAEADFICSTGFNVVDSDANRFVPAFGYYCLISDDARQHYESVATGVGYPAVSDKEFGQFTVPLPPTDEQKRIAAYLDASCRAIDAAVAAKRQQMLQLDELRQSVVEAAILGGVGKKARGATVKQDWIQRIPAHWQVVRIKRVITRMDYGISESTERDGRFPVLKMGNLQGGEVRFTNIEFVNEVDESLILESGDILYNRTNSADQVGKAALFTGSRSDEVTFASYLVRLRTNHRMTPTFLNYVVNSHGFLSFARKLAIPSVQQSNLNSTRYGRMLVPLPPIKEQHAICSYLEERIAKLGAVVATLDEQIDALAAYRKSMIHECVTGQRRITDEDVDRVTAHAASLA